MQFSYLFVAALVACGVSAQGRNGTGVAAPTGANATRPTGTTTGAPVKASTAGAPALVAQAGIAGLGVAFAAFL